MEWSDAKYLHLPRKVVSDLGFSKAGLVTILLMVILAIDTSIFRISDLFRSTAQPLIGRLHFLLHYAYSFSYYNISPWVLLEVKKGGLLGNAVLV